MTKQQRSVLITGCSDGGVGSALAVELHKAGLHVYATARNPAKLRQVKALGIQTIQLDVLSESSIAACVKEVPELDILINNAGGGYSMPFADIDIAEAKKLFDLNVWSYVSVTQAFLPLLVKSKGLVVNHTSSAGALNVPIQSAYNASKAAASMFTDTLRLEIQPFGVTVIDLKSTGISTNFFTPETHSGKLPQNSIYQPAKEKVEEIMTGSFLKAKLTAAQWAQEVTKEILKSNPPLIIWRGDGASSARMLTAVAPHGWLDGTLKKIVGFDVAEQQLRGKN